MSRTNEGKEYIEHYGVKGMQWGVRRTKAALTKASNERKAARDPNTPEGAERARRKDAAKNRRTIKDADLEQMVGRLEKEKKLKNLVEDDLSAGKKASKALLSDTGKQVAKQVLGGIAIATVSVAIGNKMGDTSDGAAKNTASQVAKLIRTGGKEKK